MFGGTCVFQKHTCPYLRSPTKTSANPPSGATCGRPHCKFSHQTAEVAPTQQSIISATVQRSSSQESLVSDFPNVESVHTNPSIAPQCQGDLEGKIADAGSLMEQNDIVAADGVSVIPNLEDSILAIQRNGLLGLPTAVAAVNVERPSYSSDSPANPPTDRGSYYYDSYDHPMTDMEYDPAFPSMSFRKTTSKPATSSDTPVSSIIKEEEPMVTETTSPAIPPQNLTGAAELRSRMASNDPMIALGRKFSAVPSVGGARVGGKIPPPAAVGGGLKRALSPGGSVSAVVRNPQQGSVLQRKKMPVSTGAVPDNLKPVKKKARYGRSADDEEPMETDCKVASAKVKQDPAGQAEIMKHLFGDEDEEEDSDVVLPIEMPAKTVPKGFPKNPEKLLQTMAAVTETSKPQAPPVLPRGQPPPKKKLLATAQQQLEMRAKALEEQRKKLPASSISSNTSPETIDKGNKRIAHQIVPTTSTGAMAMPRVINISGSKLQLPFRQQVLEKFVQLMSLIYKNPSEVAEKAFQTEHDIAKVSFHIGTYRLKVTQELANLKSASVPAPAVTNATIGEQKSDVKSAWPVKGQPGTGASQRSLGGDPKFWSDQDFHSAIHKYIITEDELVVEGYPLVQSKKQDGENRRDSIQLYIAMSGKITPDRITQTRRSCCRCKKDFTVDFEGNYEREEECIYHWGKAFSRRVSGEGMAAKRNCCSDDASSRGCSVAKCHVADTIPSLSGFVSTAGVKPTRPEQRFGVYAIDCEMIYTVGGLELARVTIVDRQLKCVYETLVRPKQRIVDCNTRFSGLKMEQFSRDAQGNSKAGIKTIEEVHKDLLGGIINEETVLIGHSLESDLLSMKFIHRNIVDTSLVFPHKRGRPFKRALRNLMRELLQKIIQEDVGGHDSREDAAACMELMIWRLRQDRDRRLL